jgi:hypothetical protein
MEFSENLPLGFEKPCVKPQAYRELLQDGVMAVGGQFKVEIFQESSKV